MPQTIIHHSSILLSNNKRATNINNCNSILMKSWHQYLSLFYPHHVSTQSVNLVLEDGRWGCNSFSMMNTHDNINKKTINSHRYQQYIPTSGCAERLSSLYPHHVSTQSVNLMLEDGRRGCNSFAMMNTHDNINKKKQSIAIDSQRYIHIPTAAVHRHV